MRLVPLSGRIGAGRSAQVDDDRFDEVMAAGPWYAQRRPRTLYAARTIRRRDGRRSTQELHQFLGGTPPAGMAWHHLDHDGLNDQASNLRCVTYRHNGRDRIKQAGTTSQYRGVYWSKRRPAAWKAELKPSASDGSVRMVLSFGYWATERLAGLAADAGSRWIFGAENAQVNIPDATRDERLEFDVQALARLLRSRNGRRALAENGHADLVAIFLASAVPQPSWPMVSGTFTRLAQSVAPSL